MRQLLMASIGISILVASGASLRADPIQLAFHEIVIDPNLSLPDTTITLPNWNGGQSGILGEIELGHTSDGIQYPYPPSQQTINGTFGFLAGQAAAPGSNQQFSGSVIEVSGNITGTLIGPSGLPPRDSGQLSGTATSVTMFDGDSPANLPPALLDLVNHPDHLHLSAVVTDGNENILQFTLSLDTPAEVPAPEPSALATLATAGAGLVLVRSMAAPRSGNHAPSSRIDRRRA